MSASRRRGLHAAIDLGASSARLFVGVMDGGRLLAKEVVRVPNGPVVLPDGLHWDVLRIHEEMLEGIAQVARENPDRELSVGVDGWGVDYGLLASDGRLLGPPYHYRDARTHAVAQEAESLVDACRVYEATGIQAMPINTLLQLLAERKGDAYRVASRLLLIPDLFGFFLTGEQWCERTNASTTQLLDARTGEFVPWLLSELGLRADLFAPMIDAGREVGGMLPQVAASVGIERVPRVVSVASHDTASAVLATPPDSAFVVSGTWSLVGMELETPVINEATRLANFSNERGVQGTIRFLRNVMGHWMLQQCGERWRAQGRRVGLAAMLDGARGCVPFRSIVDTFEPAFARPGNMPALVRDACRRTGEPVPESDGELVRCIVDSMAFAIVETLEEAQRLAHRRVRSVHVVGGGAANELLVASIASIASIASCSSLEVWAGPVEASAVGNLLVQLEVGGQVRGREAMNDLVMRSFSPRRVFPDTRIARAAERARQRWQTIAARQLVVRSDPPASAPGEGARLAGKAAPCR